MRADPRNGGLGSVTWWGKNWEAAGLGDSSDSPKVKCHLHHGCHRFCHPQRPLATAAADKHLRVLRVTGQRGRALDHEQPSSQNNPFLPKTLRYYLHFSSQAFPRASHLHGGGEDTRVDTQGHQGGDASTGVTHGDPVAAHEALSHRLRPRAAHVPHTHPPLL